jgi:hypothetical protein
MYARVPLALGPLPLASLVSALMFSCHNVPALHPYVEPNAAVLVPGITGIWREDSSKDKDVLVIMLAGTAHPWYIAANVDTATARRLVALDLPLLASDTASHLRKAHQVAAAIRLERDFAFVRRIASGNDAWVALRFTRMDSLLYADMTDDDRFPEHRGGDLRLPVHKVARLDLSADRLRLGELNENWLGDQFDSNRLDLPHVKATDSDYLLTATTEELRAFVARVARDTVAFSRQMTTTLVRYDPSARSGNRPARRRPPR